MIWPKSVLKWMGREKVADKKEVDEIEDRSLRMMARFETGLRLFASGDFQQAAECFETANHHSEFAHVALWSRYLALLSREKANAAFNVD